MSAAPEVVRFRPGDGIAWRGCIRMDATGTEHPSYANAMTVVHDTPDEVALLRRPGHLLKQRLAEGGGPAGFRHPVVRRWLDGWNEQIWHGPWRALVLKQPASGHAISLFSDNLTGVPGFWYIDLIGPVRRTAAGFDFAEHGLDVVVQLDLASWTWKDEDELEFNVRGGALYPRRGRTGCTPRANARSSACVATAPRLNAGTRGDRIRAGRSANCLRGGTRRDRARAATACRHLRSLGHARPVPAWGLGRHDGGASRPVGCPFSAFKPAWDKDAPHRMVSPIGACLRRVVSALGAAPSEDSLAEGLVRREAFHARCLTHARPEAEPTLAQLRRQGYSIGALATAPPTYPRDGALAVLRRWWTRLCSQATWASRSPAAQGDGRERLWARWREMGDDVDGYATRRPSGTVVVVLEPRSAAG